MSQNIKKKQKKYDTVLRVNYKNQFLELLNL